MADGGNTMDVKPTEDISVREMFGLDTDMVVKGFADRSERVPEIDTTYKFDPDTTMAIMATQWCRRCVIQQLPVFHCRIW